MKIALEKRTKTMKIALEKRILVAGAGFEPTNLCKPCKDLDIWKYCCNFAAANNW